MIKPCKSDYFTSLAVCGNILKLVYIQQISFEFSLLFKFIEKDFLSNTDGQINSL